MADQRYLKRRHQTWYFRLAVPSHLQDIIEPGRRIREIVETLGTTDLRVAQSKRWARREHWEQEFRRLSGKGEDTPLRSPRELYAETLSYAETAGLELVAPEPRFAQWEVERDAILEEAAKRAGLVVAEGLEELPPDLQARWDALEDYRNLRRGKNPKHRHRYGMTVREAADGFLKDVGKTATHQTVGQYEAALRLFVDFTGNKVIGLVSKRDVSRFIDEVEQFDPHWGRSPKTKDRSFSEIKALFGGGEDAVGLSNRTLNRYLTAIAGAWGWAKDREEAHGENPASGLFKPTHGKHSSPYQAYPLDMLMKLFAAPEPRIRMLWELPLVALFSGMRLNEICSLDWRDVREEEGIPFFDITAAKSEAGIRKVPIHPRLDWLMKRRKASGPIWPDLKAGGPDGKRSWYFSKQFGTFRKSRGVIGPGLKFHSFRKNAVQCLERARVPMNEAAEIVGHDKGFTYRVYNPDGLTMKQRLEVVEKIDYPDLVLPF